MSHDSGEIIEVDGQVYAVVDVREEAGEDGSTVRVTTFEPVEEKEQ